MEDFTNIFYNEAVDLLSDIEDQLMDLEENPEDSELINGIFRAMHTIKGSSGMFGFDDISKFTHEVETVLDTVREGKLKVTEKLIDLTLKSKDIIISLLEKKDIDDGLIADTIQQLQSLMPSAKDLPAAQPDNSETTQHSDTEKNTVEHTFRIEFFPDKDIFKSGNNPLHLIEELCELGYADVFAQSEHIPALEDISPEDCYTSWEIVLTTTKNENDIRDVFIFVEDLCKLNINLIYSSDEIDDNDESEVKKLGEILISQGKLKREDLDSALSKQKNIGDILVTEGLTSEEDIEAALREQQHMKNVQEKHKKEMMTNTIKVSSEKLDILIDLVGELVTSQARLSQLSYSESNAHLKNVSEEIDRLASSLRENAMSLRMVPIGTTFNKFKRLVRDLSKELGKEAVMLTDGGDTELDKTVIEKLNDPLVHIIRNCMDHGLETPEERIANKKPEKGSVHLSASQAGPDILIQINDDGKGVNPEKIRQKAIEKGVIDAQTTLSKHEMLNLLFAPGFSTAEKISSVSGRGVGMDVVKKNIESLRGTVILTSQEGMGTSVTIKIPLTLAIIEGLLTIIGDQYFVLPLALVTECIELTDKDVQDMHGKEMVNIRDTLVPYINLRKEFGIEENKPAVQQVVIIESDNHKLGFVVDSVLGNHQTVIKPLGEAFKSIDFVTGATILGDGTVGLILDVMKFMQTSKDIYE